MPADAKFAIFFDVSGTLLTAQPSRVFGFEICPDARKILNKCRRRFFAGQNVMTGAITNWGEHVHALFESLNIAECFDVVVHAQTFGVLKPNKSVFENSCKMLSLQPKYCVHVGDSLFIDALGAQRAGLQGIWLERDLTSFYGLSERDLISSLTHEPISNLHELEAVCELIFSKLMRSVRDNVSI